MKCHRLLFINPLVLFFIYLLVTGPCKYIRASNYIKLISQRTFIANKLKWSMPY